MVPAEYIVGQPPERQQLLSDIHAIIIAGDKTVTPMVEPMMGKEMILYEERSFMKYGLASTKKYMSLHLLPMYMAPKIYDYYKPILSQANFQKGCINFSSAAEMPLNIVKQLISDCALIDVLKIRNDYLEAKKLAKKK